ncbi:uncharacterized protein HMPREF1541_03618 [Cyphellophora europaea CBS 101466]|uniref:DNA-directed RNA polymerase n=1 Tax=Cyphellophora europaea (strain CBS 101466) TaxID=1220924 RepID=W2RYZ8_CYPE1|nr:uncharacterized protein HMPREF1541_03618 [Cyphellophora europaea CBS 101466]ETN41682.1 hypothetical protein HMPREF1541_03618 [Cyphellophora europaea CBS 101466]
MLTRAARRRQALRYAHNAAEHLQLPFLCPALRFPHITANQQRPIASRTLSRTRPLPSQPSQSRQLASAAPFPDLFDRNDDYSSYLPPREYRSDSLGSGLATLPKWDPSLRDMVKIDNTTLARPAKVIAPNHPDVDIRGNSNEIETNLDACLQLKKWPRAMTNLAQLKAIYSAGSAELLRSYNFVLAYMVEDLVDSHTPEVEQRITQWIERDMKQAGLEPDAQTFALVIKASLAVPSRSKRDRTVRRYWDMAKRYDLQGEVGNLRDILTERDLGLISRICPLEVGDFPEFEALASENPEIILNEDVLSQQPDLQIRETEQKGTGMAALRETLSLFSDEEDQTRMRLAAEPADREAHAYERQARLERDAIASSIARWKREHEKMAKMGITAGLNSGRMGVYMWQWHKTLTTKIIAELKKVQEAEKKPKKNAEDKLRMEYGPFLQQLKPEKLAAVTALGMVQIINKAGASKPIKLVRLVCELGKTIESEHHAERLYERSLRWTKKRRQGQTIPEIIKNLNENPDRPSSWGVTTRGNHPGAQKFLHTSEWTTTIHVKLGAILCELMMDTAKMQITKTNEITGKEVTVAQPVFLRQTVFSNGKKVGIVSLHEEFLNYLVNQPSAEVLTKQLPMVCKPLPWTDFNDGAYLGTRVPALRVKHGEVQQKDYAVAAANNGDLDQILQGLHVLGSVPWKINEQVFHVMIQAWNKGEPIANLAPLHRHFDVPERPPADAPNRAKHDWFSRMREIDNQRSGDHSNRCFQNFQMEIAKAYLHETFYLPHNMDFRGRAYPIPPFLNQMGADNARGLLLFANGRPLGEQGLRWLKIHLSNVFGYDKASLSDRAQFPIDHIEEIRDAVANPLDGQKWWLKAEDPWQCLAACHELVKALDSGNPEEFVSHLPVHQDGSCNGLQHYAALGGDVAGARQVNLEPGDKPADVYTGVAELVAADVAIDAANGHEMAKLVDGRLKRKIVKQTVMTNVYGVTFIGATQQVRKQIDDLLPDILEARLSGRVALYVAGKIFKALGSLFTGAHQIQYWLGDCANRISSSVSPAQMAKLGMKANSPVTDDKTDDVRKTWKKKSKKDDALPGAEFRTSVIWTTPLKLPVVQPYRKAQGSLVQTNLQSITLHEPTAADSVDKRKQLQAFPPNFIHSLDATHMILSALKSKELGLDFAAVHDSFWTHAADIDTLNRLLRDGFIRMHSEDIIGRLAAEFKKRYEGHLYMAQILKTSKLAKAIRQYRTDHRDVLGSSNAKNIKARKHAELLREIEKRQLMASDDPEERRKGEEMVTAATLFERYGGEDSLIHKDSLGQTAIASMPKGPEQAQIAEALRSPTDVDVDLGKTLNPLVDDMDGDADDINIDHDAELEADAAAAQAGKKKKTPSAGNNQTWLWLPLTFRPVPQKGAFDVTRLKDSQYFFS